MKIINLVFSMIFMVLIIGLVSGFSNLARRPVTTILFFGFDVQRMLAGWRLGGLSWVIGIAITIAIWLTVLSFIAWVYKKAKEILGRYKSNKGGNSAD